ncbi:peptidoglycan DD-metalloendopeptidase family protein [Paraglaciecola aquimarina]|uniref:Peptidoglycan DD-metalloendopeptidase family protein n=1 Tax=Paraglaciecola aquimarina TaxID=1235557 RepID=A0ABU3SV33_9ALTE|nr:peptidoglycan DD-metalloendopeptidase family protein [Paraglaciecola aquimarina]MDU0353852.1 peptidoglycan DD-metalloendopeptidase family protein [Paraglaciecola aquimarina]
MLKWFKSVRLHSGSILIFCLGLLASSCTNRSQPAPVIELYQGKTYIDFQAEHPKPTKYVVNKGDTLFSIAWYSGKDYQELAKLNGIKKPYNIYPDQTIYFQKTARSRVQKPPQKVRKKAVDLPKKQAYGESEDNVNSDSTESSVGKFPNQVKLWGWPTSKPVSEGFSAKENGNKGLDFSGKLGEPILAAADGKVVYTGKALRGFGNLIIIKHSEAYLSAYAHNSQLLVKEQQWVKRGQHIANMGSSGTDKVKLHFEVRYKGKSINPLNYLPKR